MLNDPVTAQYTHTLNVTAEGVYTCAVANSVSFSSADITLKHTSFQSFVLQIILVFLLHNIVPQPPTEVIAVQDGLTSITVTWTASSDATGYRISYNSSEGDSGSADVSGDNHILTGLVREDIYTISITARFQTLSSSPVTVEVTLSEPVLCIMILIFFPTSKTGDCGSECHNSHLHLPLLECVGWLSGQVRGGVERD